MTRASLLFGAVMLAACETRAPGTDSTAILPVNTVGPVVVNAAMDSVRRADSIRIADSLARATKAAAARPVTKAPTRTPATSSPTSDSARGHPNIGRDSVIRRPRPMPVDTTHRP